MRHPLHTALHTALRGGAAGLVATAAMSGFMIAAERLEVLRGQPPRMIVDRLAPGLGEGTADAAALVSHGAYGALAGALYALLGGRRRGMRLSGAGYGVLIWIGGYEGWVPALGVLPPAHRDRRSRAAVMLAAHVIYGSLLGRLLEHR